MRYLIKQDIVIIIVVLCVYGYIVHRVRYNVILRQSQRNSIIPHSVYNYDAECFPPYFIMQIYSLRCTRRLECISDLMITVGHRAFSQYVLPFT